MKLDVLSAFVKITQPRRARAWIPIRMVWNTKCFRKASKVYARKKCAGVLFFTVEFSTVTSLFQWWQACKINVTCSLLPEVLDIGPLSSLAWTGRCVSVELCICGRAEGNIQDIETEDVGSNLGSTNCSQCVFGKIPSQLWVSLSTSIGQNKTCSQEKSKEHGCEARLETTNTRRQQDDWEMFDKEETSSRGGRGGARLNAGKGKDFGYENRGG